MINEHLDRPDRSRRLSTNSERTVGEILLALKDQYFPDAVITSGVTTLTESDFVFDDSVYYKSVCFMPETYNEGELEGVPTIMLSFSVESDTDLLNAYEAFKLIHGKDFQAWNDFLGSEEVKFCESVLESSKFKNLHFAIGKIFQIPDRIQAADFAGWERISYSLSANLIRVDSHLLDLLTRPTQSEQEARFEQMIEEIEEQPWSPDREAVLDAWHTLGLPEARPEGGRDEFETRLRVNICINIRFGEAEELARGIDNFELKGVLPDFKLPKLS